MDFIQAKKRLGQNFLKNKIILEKIVESVSVTNQDLIIEIGPGMGALTEFLFQKNCFLVCYEIDNRMEEYLNKYNTIRSQVIFEDFLKSNIKEDIKKYNYQKLYVVANIPYYITSPIISKLISLDLPFQEIVLLVQKEFAERIVATHNHKEYNAFTLYVDYAFHSELLFLVNRKDFFPVPNVDSAVIKLTKKETIGVQNKEFYLQFIKDAFLNKRKTLKNNLKKYNWDKIKKILEDLGYSDNVRAEEISKEDFKKLVNAYEKQNEK